MGICHPNSIGRKEYIIAVLGLDRSGKTSLVNLLMKNPSGTAMPTIGFSHCDVEIDKKRVTFYDLGGSCGIRDIWKNYYAEVHGFIYVVDGMDKGRIEENRMVLSDVLAHCWVRGKPLLLLINKRNRKEDMNELEITEQLQIRRYAYAAQCPYRTVVSSVNGNFRHRRVLRNGISWLMRQIDESSDWLSDKIASDRAVQRRQLKEENERRLERIQAMHRASRSEQVSVHSQSSSVQDEELIRAATPEVETENSVDLREAEKESEELPPIINSVHRPCCLAEMFSRERNEIELPVLNQRKRRRRRLARLNRITPVDRVS